MGMTDADQEELGRLIERERKRQFNTKKAAYNAAGVNEATWSRAEDGQGVRPDRLRLIVRLLWPESEGEWPVVLEAARYAAPIAEGISRPDDREAVRRYIEHAHLSAATKEQLLRVLEGGAS